MFTVADDTTGNVSGGVVWIIFLHAHSAVVVDMVDFAGYPDTSRATYFTGAFTPIEDCEPQSLVQGASALS